jgi:ubiquinone/menaquinone biosynthesis C-methylase UbiE
MTAHLARYFETVYGLDVSSEMIEYARDRVPSNVSLYVTNGIHIPLEDGSVDAVFSTHVLQHLATTQAAASYFKEMHRVLVGGGSIMIHVLILAWPWGSFLNAHKVIHVGKSLWDASLTQLRRYAFRCGLALAPPMQMSWYETTWLYEKLNELGFEDIEIRILFGGSKMAVQHPFLFARKKS